jgi:hypothetical protein
MSKLSLKRKAGSQRPSVPSTGELASPSRWQPEPSTSIKRDVPKRTITLVASPDSGWGSSDGDASPVRSAKENHGAHMSAWWDLPYYTNFPATYYSPSCRFVNHRPGPSDNPSAQQDDAASLPATQEAEPMQDAHALVYNDDAWVDDAPCVLSEMYDDGGEPQEDEGWDDYDDDLEDTEDQDIGDGEGQRGEAGDQEHQAWLPSHQQGDAPDPIQPTQPKAQQPPPQRCKVCNTDIAGLHYLQQVSHVKQCMKGRGGGAAAAKPRAAPAVVLPPGRSVLDMPIQDWLEV